MAVRRLHPDQPPSFVFNAENLAWVKETIAKYPPGKQASAVIPVLWRAQEQHGGWLPEPAIRAVADMLGMAYIRVYEVATFYTMFQLAPVGTVAHVQVCGTTPCMLRGSGELIEACKRRIHPEPHHLSADGRFSWEEVECLGSCANAPMVQIWKDTYEDLTPELLERVIDGFAKGTPPKPGSQTGRTASCPSGGPTSLKDPSLFDGSRIGSWQARFAETAASGVAAASTAVAPGAASAAPAAAAPATAAPPAAAASGTVATLPGAASAAAAVPAKPGLAQSAADSAVSIARSGSASTASGGEIGASKPQLLAAARDGGKGDDLGLIWGVGDKLHEKLNAMGIWHFDQIAAWTPAEVAWFEAEMQGFKGRVERDKWIEQCKKLSTGWRPDHAAGERPKG